MNNRKFHAFTVSIIWTLLLGVPATVSAQTVLPAFSKSVPDDLKGQFVRDLKMVQELQGSGGTPIYRQIFSDSLNGPSLVDFLTKRILTVDLDDCGGTSGIMACANSAQIMWITQNYLKQDMPQIYRIGIVFHESRHTEREHREWWHINCPVPFLDEYGYPIKALFNETVLEGLPACDEAAFGAYGLQVVLFKNVELFCTNCSNKMKMDAKIFGADFLRRIVGREAHEMLIHDVQEKK